MTDIPKEMLERAFAAYLAEGVRRDAGRSSVEAAIRAALQPLPMESAPKDGSHVALYSHGDGEIICTVPCFWSAEAEGWLVFPDIYQFEGDDEDLIGWFPIIGGNHD